jgi:hypothetical protein
MAEKTSAGWALRVMEDLYIPYKEYVKCYFELVVWLSRMGR